MELSENFRLRKVVARLGQAAAIGSNKAGQNMRLTIEIGQGHQMKSIFAGPAKAFFAARTTHPDGRMGTLHRLWYHRDVLILEELSFEIDRLVRPSLANDFHP